jgi:CheY-like chemotaxis protein
MHRLPPADRAYAFSNSIRYRWVTARFTGPVTPGCEGFLPGWDLFRMKERPLHRPLPPPFCGPLQQRFPTGTCPMPARFRRIGIRWERDDVRHAYVLKRRSFQKGDFLPPDLPPMGSEPGRLPEVPRKILPRRWPQRVARSLETIQRRRGHETRIAFPAWMRAPQSLSFRRKSCGSNIGLPGMGGWEVAARPRAMPALRGVDLIPMTGDGRDDDRAKVRLGFDGETRRLRSTARGAAIRSLSGQALSRHACRR